MKLFMNVSSFHLFFRRHCSSSEIKRIATISNETVRIQRNRLFDEEKQRQKSLTTRIEKIQVELKGPPEECTLIMNKDISTPYNCALHIGEVVSKRATLAMVDGALWDMHRPLKQDCQLKFLHFKQEDPRQLNKVFWRSCSFLLGYLIERAFKNDLYVELHSWPAPNIQSGCFIYDADLKMPDWLPTQDELQVLNTTMRKFIAEDHAFERLDVNTKIALEMFEDNKYKKEQIPRIAAQSSTQNTVTLYRLNDHIDISCGPMIGNINLVGSFALAAVHKIQTDDGCFHRFQGVALPKQLPLHYYTFSVLIKRAAKMIQPT